MRCHYKHIKSDQKAPWSTSNSSEDAGQQEISFTAGRNAKIQLPWKIFSFLQN